MADDAYSAIQRLMLSPPGLGRGWTELVRLTQPAAGSGLTRSVPNNVWWRPRAVRFLFTADTNTPPRQLVVRYLSPDAQIITETPVGIQVGPSGAVSCYAWPGAPATPQAGLSVEGSASVTSPALGATIASVTLPQGTWTINWAVRTSGTVAAADNNNMQLQQGAAVLEVADVPQGASNVSQQQAVVVTVPAGGATISVNAIALATVGAIYTAQINATPGETLAAYAPLPDLLLRSGWQLQVTATGLQVGDQISAAFALVDMFPSGYASGADWQADQEAEAAVAAAIWGGG